MMVLITYDVNTEDSGGRKRLRQITKQCVNYGQRVQNSVFECLVDAAQCKQLQHKLLAIMDEERTAYAFITLETSMKPASSTSAQRRATLRRARSLSDANRKHSGFPREVRTAQGRK